MVSDFWYQWFGVGHHGVPNTAYSFWSGVGSCLFGLPLFAPGIILWRHLACHQRGCWRIGRHRVMVAGITHHACARHVRDVHTRAKEVLS